MAQHAQERPSSAYILTSTVQSHHQHQLAIRRHPADSSSSSANTRNNICCYSQDKQHSAVLKMSIPIRSTVPQKRPFPGTDLANDRVLQAYYKSFYHAHPMMLPFSLLRGPLAGNIPGQIIDIMRYIGMHYQKVSLPEDFIDKALSTLDPSTLSERNGFHVQGMILLAICAHAHGKSDQALGIIQQAVQLALELGMHTEAFVSSNSHGSSHIKEMWRRTYWELYVVATLLSALGGFSPNLPASEVLLPSDEALIVTSDSESPSPSDFTFQNLNDSWPQTLNFDHGLPSFGYRILAVHLLYCVLTYGSYSAHTGNGDREIDEALSELLKRKAVQAGMRYVGNATHFQEMIFQGQMIANSASIHLYRPQSALISVPFEDLAFVGFFPRGFVQSAPLLKPEVISGLLDDPAQGPLLDAAKAIAHELTSPVHEDRHSPFLVNATVLSIVVLMAARYNLKPNDRNRELYQNYITNALGVLGRVEKTWPWVKGMKANLGKVYKQLFQ